MSSTIEDFDRIESMVDEEPGSPSLLADDLAYILYTSGSTGDPKGIMLTHRNAYRFIDWMRREFGVNPSDRIFNRAPLQFDLSVFDIYTTFAAGATLVIAPLEFSNKPEDIVSFMIENKVTAEDVLILPTVTLIHIGVLPALLGKNGVMFLDKAAHMTIYEAGKMARDSGSILRSYSHEDYDTLEAGLEEHKDNPKKLILVDGTYSMTGDYADIPRLQELAHKYNAIVYVDDAHGWGVCGEAPDAALPYGYKGNGVVKHFGCDYSRILYVGGLSKAYSSLAAFIQCDAKMKAFLKAYATPYDLSGPCPTASLQSVLAGLAVNAKLGDKCRKNLYRLTKKTIDGLRNLGFRVDNKTYFPIVPVYVGDISILVETSKILWDTSSTLLVTSELNQMF